MARPHKAAGERRSPCQREALKRVRERALNECPKARAQLTSILRRADVTPSALDGAVRGLQNARVVLHFHPDRVTKDGRSVAHGLLADGVYRSQFETGISSGSPTGFAGGERDLWERELFGGAYHGPGVKPEDRPKYGSLEVFRYGDGPSPRFGSCYFVLKPHVSAYCSFTYGDSYTKPEAAGTIDALNVILAAFLEDVEHDGAALGADDLTVEKVIHYLSNVSAAQDDDPALRPVGRVLDEYIEAQIHGPVDLRTDVERLVIDPSFHGTETATHLRQMCDRYGIDWRLHRGFRLPVDRVPPHFRGPTMISLARRIAEVTGTDHLDARVIGIAAAAAGTNPERWSEFGDPALVLRRFRQIWHVVVAFGEPQ